MAHPKHVRVIARPFRNTDLEPVEAVTMPLTYRQQKQPSGKLDPRAAERTAELVTANDDKRRRTIEHRKVNAYLLESQAALDILSAPERVRARLPDTKQVSKRMLCGISPIGETSPFNFKLSSEESSF